MTLNCGRLFGLEPIQRRTRCPNPIPIAFRRTCKTSWLDSSTNTFVFSIRAVEANCTRVITTHVCFPCVFQRWTLRWCPFDNTNTVHSFTIREIWNVSMKIDERICYGTAKPPCWISFESNFRWPNTMEIPFTSMFFRPRWVEKKSSLFGPFDTLFCRTIARFSPSTVCFEKLTKEPMDPFVVFNEPSPVHKLPPGKKSRSIVEQTFRKTFFQSFDHFWSFDVEQRDRRSSDGQCRSVAFLFVIFRL